jgi:hypothetical protein
VTFSPAYEQDGVLLTRAGDVVYRSSDQGTNWQRVLEVDPLPIHVVFSPEYDRDGVIYLLQGHVVHRSTDRGQSWQALPVAPWSEYEDATLVLSPGWPRDGILLAWTISGQVYQSSDGGQTWQDVSAGLGGDNLRQVLFSPDYAVAGRLYAVPAGPGLYKRAGDSPWLPVTESERPDPTPVPVPTSVPEPTTVPIGCDVAAVRFQAVWQQAQARLGCPRQVAEQAYLAEQPFEQGRMVWDSSDRQIYVLLQQGTWQAYQDTWAEGQPDWDPALVPPDGRHQPVRGFGKVWREQLGGPQAAIGWALGPEGGLDGWRQSFEGGLLIWTDAVPRGGDAAGTAYLLYEDGTWQEVPAPAP